MGKKTKKTKWRTLEIPSPGKHYESSAAAAAAAANARWHDERSSPSANYQHCDKLIKGQRVMSTTTTTTASSIASVNSSNFKFTRSYCRDEENHVKTLIEDEYTKITTPRQDVLFKKGYLTKRKVVENTYAAENTYTSDNDIDGVGIAQQDCINGEEFSSYANGSDSLAQLVCPAPQPPYIDPSSAIYYGGGYEIYDPYTGSVTAVVVGASATGQPLLSSMPCRPVPLQPVQWFNPVPSSDWCCSYAQQNGNAGGDGGVGGKRYSTDSQNEHGGGGSSSVVSSESSCAPESPTSLTDDQTNNNNHITNNDDGSCAFPPSYIYPGYMFGAPIYNVDGVNVQYCTAEGSILSGSDSTVTKKKKKRKRRRRFGETAEDGSESSVDETCNGSISSNECILDCASREELAEYDNTIQNESRLTFEIHSCGTDLPHANVNAPAFVPAAAATDNHSLVKLATAEIDQLEELSTQSSVRFTNPLLENDRDHCHRNGDNYVTTHSNSSADLKSYCEPYRPGSEQNKQDIDVGSSCNNSDSGISSPGSEDSSLTAKDFKKCLAKGEKSKFNGTGTCTNSDRDQKTANSATATATASCAVNTSATASAKYSSDNGCEKNNDSKLKDGHGVKNVKICANRPSGEQNNNDKSSKKNRTKKSSRTAKNKPLSGLNEGKSLQLSNVTDVEKTGKNQSFMLVDVERNQPSDLDNTEAKPKQNPKFSCNFTNNFATSPTENKLPQNLKSNLQNGNEKCEKLESQFSKRLVLGENDLRDHLDETKAKFDEENFFSEKNYVREQSYSNIDAGVSDGHADERCLVTSLQCHTQLSLPKENSEKIENINVNVDQNSTVPVSVSVSNIYEGDVLTPTTEYSCTIANDDQYNVVETCDNSTYCADQPCLGDKISTMSESAPLDRLVHIEEKPLLAKLVDVDTLLEDGKQNIPQLEEFSNFASCRENERCGTHSQNTRVTRQMVKATAQSVVEDIIHQAEARIHHSSVKCDKFQLPITQAVTNWLNERGGLPTVETDDENSAATAANDVFKRIIYADENCDEKQKIAEPVVKSNSSSLNRKKTKFICDTKSTKSQTSCVIC